MNEFERVRRKTLISSKAIDVPQDGYWVHKDTAVKTYFGADADFITNGVMSRPNWMFDAIEIKLCSGINDFELTGLEVEGEIVEYACYVFVDINFETGEGGNDVLQSIDMSNTAVNTLPIYIFASCTYLTSSTLPEGLTNIGDAAFMGCVSLTSITLPNSLTSIGDAAFIFCSSLTSITFPNSLTSIGDNAFVRCNSLSLVTSLPTIPPLLVGSAFDGTHANLNIKVPSQSVNAYKAATNWNYYADKIIAI